jgi:hypothetical protein
MRFLTFRIPQDEARKDVLCYPGGTSGEIEEILGDIRITEWVKVFNEWKSRLKRCIDASIQKTNISEITNLMLTFYSR